MFILPNPWNHRATKAQYDWRHLKNSHLQIDQFTLIQYLNLNCFFLSMIKLFGNSISFHLYLYYLKRVVLFCQNISMKICVTSVCNHTNVQKIIYHIQTWHGSKECRILSETLLHQTCTNNVRKPLSKVWLLTIGYYASPLISFLTINNVRL